MSVIAAAVIGSAVVGGAASKSAAKKAAASNDRATQAAADATAERLAFDERVYDEGKADRAFASNMARRMAGWQEQDRNEYRDLQHEQVARGRKFQSAEDQMLVEAQGWDTPARREAAAGAAMADVNAGFESARGQQQRALSRMGANPASGKALALDNQWRIQQATGLASAANRARQLTEVQGLARRMDALGLGKGLIGNQATQAGLQLDAGNSAVKNGQVPISVSGVANDRMSSALGNAASGFGLVSAMRSSDFYGAEGYGLKMGNGVGGMFGGMTQQIGGLMPSGGAGFGTLAYANKVGASGGDAIGALGAANGWWPG